MFDHDAPSPAAPQVLTVSQLNRQVRLAIERNLNPCWIAGEISNLTRAPSGHWYFTLKDEQAAVRCAMFRNRNQFIDWRPGNGDQVEVRAQATLYEPRGEFQLSVDAMRRAGLGALFEAFQRLKAQLEREGLFDPDRKRPLPAHPTSIGVITSTKAAALRDVLTTLRRRWPVAQVIVYPTLVQGKTAAGQIAEALRLAGERAECQVLLLVRGGGGLEDLWAFNEEQVARAIAASPIPVVSGVGHETDFTIADFAADLRAPTPTGAAQLATPDRQELARRLGEGHRRLLRLTGHTLDQAAQRLDGLMRRLRHPAERLTTQRRHLAQLERRLAFARGASLERTRRRLDDLRRRLERAAPRPAGRLGELEALRRRLRQGMEHRLDRQRQRLGGLTAQLGQLNPQAVLGRGYGIVRDAAGRIVRDAGLLRPEAVIAVTLAKGHLAARVTGIAPANGEDQPEAYTETPKLPNDLA